MKIQSICADQQTNFGAMKVRKLNVKPKLSTQRTYEQEQNRNSMHAILFALAFVAAALTKCFIDVCNGKYKHQPVTQTAVQQSSKQADKNVYQLK